MFKRPPRCEGCQKVKAQEQPFLFEFVPDLYMKYGFDDGCAPYSAEVATKIQTLVRTHYSSEFECLFTITTSHNEHRVWAKEVFPEALITQVVERYEMTFGKVVLETWVSPCVCEG